MSGWGRAERRFRSNAEVSAGVVGAFNRPALDEQRASPLTLGRRLLFNESGDVDAERSRHWKGQWLLRKATRESSQLVVAVNESGSDDAVAVQVAWTNEVARRRGSVVPEGRGGVPAGAGCRLDTA